LAQVKKSNDKAETFIFGRRNVFVT